MKSKQYVSEFEQFMDHYLQQHPEVEADKLRAWRLWWEIPVRPGLPGHDEKNAVPRQAYCYD